MSETDVDLRGYGIVLVAHGLLGGGAEPSLRRRIVSWADERGWGVYQLPESSHAIGGGGLSADDHRREDVDSLGFVLSQIRVYLDHGYRLEGVLLHADEIAGTAGAAWLDTLRAGLRDAGIAVARSWVAAGSSAEEPIDTALLREGAAVPGESR